MSINITDENRNFFSKFEKKWFLILRLTQDRYTHPSFQSGFATRNDDFYIFAVSVRVASDSERIENSREYFVIDVYPVLDTSRFVEDSSELLEPTVYFILTVSVRVASETSVSRTVGEIL